MGLIRVIFGFMIAWVSFTLILTTENIFAELLGIIVLLGGLYLIAWSEKLEQQRIGNHRASIEQAQKLVKRPQRRPIQHRAINMPIDEDELTDEAEDAIQRHGDDK